MNEIAPSYGKLTVLHYVGRSRYGAVYATLCECGNERTVAATHLRLKQVTECSACAKARRQRHKNAVFFR